MYLKKYLMIKKEQFNNICPLTMEYSRARGCICTKILTILSFGRHCALSPWIWILAILDSLEVRYRGVKDLEVKTDKTLNSLKVYSWDQPGYEKLFSLVTSKANPWPLMLLEQISLLAAL